LRDAVDEISIERLVGVVGFSLGGSMALHLARDLGQIAQFPVILLDAYAPAGRKRGSLRRLERAISYLFWPYIPVSAPSSGQVPVLAGFSDAVVLTQQNIWDALMVGLDSVPHDAKGAEVYLIQAQTTVLEVGLLWRRRTSGFNPAAYRRFSVLPVQCEHLDLPRNRAEEVARLIVSASNLDMPSAVREVLP
jgi:pimeloyl-ACP methyl ester carboxylesterase